jgi:tryptophan halogenase
MIKKIVIVGGGFAGWYTACAFQHHLKDIELVLIDSDKHPTIGVGEVTGWDAPINFQRLLGIENDHDLMEKTGAVYKYGVRAVDFWGDHTVHQWGKFPNLKVSSLTNFYNGYDYPDFEEPWNRQPGDIGMFLAWLTINKDKKRTYDDFIQETLEQYHFISNSVAPYNRRNQYVLRNNHGYAYHIDAEKTSVYLRELFYTRGDRNFNWYTSTIKDIVFDENDGCQIKKLKLENDMEISADLFIDCTGLKRVLVGASANDSWLPSGNEYNDSAWAAPSRYLDPEKELTGVSEFFGEDWGWRFKVRLYHRIGNGYVFNSNLVDPAVPLERFKNVLGESLLREPKLISWKPGQYSHPWQGNIIPLGLSFAFVDPYDSSTFDAHSKSLDDLIPLIKTESNNAATRKKYNNLRDLTREERNLRLDLALGLSRRRGPFWDVWREKAKRENYLETIQKLVLEQRPDLDSRLNWHWHQIYGRVCMAADVDMSAWDFPEISDADRDMAQAFFKFNRARNKYISTQHWMSYSAWLRENRFSGLTNEEVLQKINPSLY